MRRGGAQRQRAPVVGFLARSVLPHQRRKSTKARIETTRVPPVASHHFARNRCLGASLP